MSDKKRNSFLAFIFSFCAPGLGQIYKGQHKKGMTFLFIAIAFSLVITLTPLLSNFIAMASSVISFLLIYLYNIIDALIPLKQEFKKNWYNKWYYYIAIVLFWMASSELLSTYSRENHYEAFKIPTAQHSPTLKIGDHILVKKSAYNKDLIARFDNVIYKRPDDPSTEKDESKKTIIKRIIGLPKDKVEISDGKVFINDQAIDEPYAIWLEGGIEKFGPYYVPEEKYFLLGDNRDKSKDSRYYNDPFIPKENIKGKALYIYLNLRNFGRAGNTIR